MHTDKSPLNPGDTIKAWARIFANPWSLHSLPACHQAASDIKLSTEIRFVFLHLIWKIPVIELYGLYTVGTVTPCYADLYWELNNNSEKNISWNKKKNSPEVCIKRVMILPFEVEYSKASGNPLSKIRKAFLIRLGYIKFYWLNVTLNLGKTGMQLWLFISHGFKNSQPFPQSIAFWCRVPMRVTWTKQVPQITVKVIFAY